MDHFHHNVQLQFGAYMRPQVADETDSGWESNYVIHINRSNWIVGKFFTLAPPLLSFNYLFSASVVSIAALLRHFGRSRA